MPYKEFKIIKKYYKVGEVAEMIGVTSQAIRDRDEYFNVSPSRTTKYYRRYEKKDIDKHRIIEELLSTEGYTQKGALRQIKKNGWTLREDITL